MGGTIGYRNGHVPDAWLVTFNEGYDPGEGHWKWQLSPGTFQKHQRLVELAKNRTGKTLTLSGGWSGYRPYQAQVYARQIYGMGAAVPGTSSHGGVWFDGPRGQRVALAIDYGNWGDVYGWDRAAFYADVRAAGLEPGLIHPSRGNGYPDEPWHVIDLDPWAAPADTEQPDQSEEDDMNDRYCWYRRADGVIVNAIYNTTSGYFQSFESNVSTYNTAKAQGHRIPASFEVSESDFRSIQNACAEVRAGKK